MRKSILNAIFIGIGSRATGGNVVLLYASKIFASVLDMERSGIIGNIAMSASNCLPVLVPLLTLKYVGRKKFMIIGLCICCVCLFGLTLFNIFDFENKAIAIIVVSAVF